MMKNVFSDILEQACRASSEVLQVSSQDMALELSEAVYDSRPGCLDCFFRQISLCLMTFMKECCPL